MGLDFTYCSFHYQSNEFEKFEVYILKNTYQFENCIADVRYTEV